MAWIESNQGIKDHPKTLLLASRMGWDVYTTIGRLHVFWWWCLEYAPTGDLRKFNDAVLAGSVGLNASEGSLFVNAMVEACWLDRGRNVFRVHDWVEYAGRYLRDSKFKNRPEKWQEVLDLYDIGCRQKVGRKSAEKPPNQPTRPNQPDLTNAREGCGLPDWVPEKAWQGFIEMRVKKKKEPTERAIALIITALEELKSAGHDPEAVLNQSTVRGWLDVFPLKTQGVSNGTSKHIGLAKKDYTAGVDEFNDRSQRVRGHHAGDGSKG